MSNPILIERNDKGIYISAPDKTHLSDIVDFLAREEVTVTQPEALDYIITHPDEMVLISDSVEAKEARVSVDIPRDLLTARVSIEPPIGEKPWPELSEIKSLLEIKTIVYGVDDQAIMKMLQEKTSHTWVVVAKGISPIDGVDAVIDYKVDFGNKKPLVDDDEDAKVNLKELSSIALVSKDQLLVHKTPRSEGSDGISVFGKTIKAKQGKDFKLPAGEGTYQSEEGTELYAFTDGHMLTRRGKLDVLEVYTVPGDVDYSIGNIHFTGSVNVKGAVRDGFEVKTTGDIVIGGVVEGAVLETDNNLNVKIGITAGNKGHIKTGGSVSTGYIDKATVSAGENIVVKDVVMHSTLNVDGYVSVGASGGKGQLMGGSVVAGLGLCCATLGSEMGTRTRIEVGISPNLLNRKNELKAYVDENKDKVVQINSNLVFLKKVDKAGKLTDEKRAIMLKLTKGSFKIQALLKQWNDEIIDIEQKIDKSRTDAKVSVKKTCYPGVSVSMRGLTYVVREKLTFVTFVYEDGEIKQISYTP